jgi:Zn-dependent M28 family amino/carboxypeptidase
VTSQSRRNSVLPTILLAAVTAAHGAPAEPTRVDRGELMRVVRTLSSPSFEGRRTSTSGGLAARRFIHDAFAAIGLAPAAADYLQPFTFVSTGPARGGRRSQTAFTDAANVIAMERGTTADERAIVVSAHYDHLGTRNGAVYPGADDNASGVAALLAVARYVHTHPLTHRIVFAAFDAEELDLEGARAFLRTPPVPVSAMVLNINFDMVSRNARHEIYAAGVYQTPSLKPIVDDVQRRTSVAIEFGHDRPTTRGRDDWTLQSDHGVFYQAGVPFLYFGVEDHPDYHRPTDTADKIDPVFFGHVVDMLIDVVVTADARVR